MIITSCLQGGCHRVAGAACLVERVWLSRAVALSAEMQTGQSRTMHSMHLVARLPCERATSPIVIWVVRYMDVTSESTLVSHCTHIHLVDLFALPHTYSGVSWVIDFRFGACSG